MTRLLLLLLLFPMVSLTGASDLPPLVNHHHACQARPEQQRLWQEQGDNYRLQLGSEAVTVIGRRTWGAQPSIPAGRSWQAYPPEQPFCRQVQRMTIHHTHSTYTPLSLQQRHQTQADPKADVGYHFLIDVTGDIYEGRPLGLVGSHSEQDNRGNIGIALNGDFQHQAPTAAQSEALRKLVTALRCPCSDWEGIWTHRDRKRLNFPAQTEHHTTCPGDVLAAEVERLAAALALSPKNKKMPENAPKP